MKVFIGYDPRQPIAFQVCAQSVWDHASEPVEIVRLDLRTLPIKRRGLTEFTYSRFLVPYLCGFKGSAVFLDSDILVRADICWLKDWAFEEQESVHVVTNEHLKFERPSVMAFRNDECTLLTPRYIDDARNKLFDFAWAEAGVGDLPKEWNHLVGYDPPNPDAKIVHFTRGIPVWPETGNCEFAKEWVETYKRMNSTCTFQELMGQSVHWPKAVAQ